MIPVRPKKEPANFEATVRKPGKAWMKKHPKKRPHPFWREVKEPLRNAFLKLCGYAAMYVPDGTVDHFFSCKKKPELAYEWSNYRFAMGLLNATKKDADDEIVDPFEVQDGWFEILLPSLQMRVTDATPLKMRKKAETTLRRLKLDHGEAILRTRREWYQLYQEKKLTLAGLREMAPLIAAAVDKQITPKNR